MSCDSRAKPDMTMHEVFRTARMEEDSFVVRSPTRAKTQLATDALPPVLSPRPTSATASGARKGKTPCRNPQVLIVTTMKR